jgi:alpha-galactosidase
MKFAGCSFAVLLLAVCSISVGQNAAPNLDVMKAAPSSIILDGANAAPGNLRLDREWDGALCRSRLVNTGASPARVKEVTLFSLPLNLPPETRVYGEGFTMLSQSGGTLGEGADIGCLTDAKHYKIPQPADARAFYGMMTLSPPAGGNVLFAFSSCRKFVGKFYLRPQSLEVVIDGEGLTLDPGESWDLEEFMFATGPDHEALLSDLAARIVANHPPLRAPHPPAGWCSWYCFGPGVTAEAVRSNLDYIESHVPELRYIQIDDGYQAAMGDWLDTGKAFGGDIRGVLKEIRERGFQPAIWVAPFIAEENSRVFKEHPDWFVKGEDGNPMPSNAVSFGGWRNGPWYALDGTNPEAQRHLEEVFRTLRNDWGCAYFKMDANFWGAIHGGKFFDAKATRVEAYRRGMDAIARGAGDAFLLGCNHPIWPSFGKIHGSRASMDIERKWSSFANVARENFNRNWQNGRLWWNDPDCIVLTGGLPDNEFQAHATAILATGGMALSGDDLTKISPERLALLKKLVPPRGVSAVFSDPDFTVGEIPGEKEWIVCVFNWGDASRSVQFSTSQRCSMKDFWTGEDLGECEGAHLVKDMLPHSAKAIVCAP